MKKQTSKDLIVSVISLVCTALYIYGAYALYYEFDYWPDNISSLLYFVLMTIAFAFFGFLFVYSICKDKIGKLKGIFSALGGGLLFNGVFWITNALISNNEDVIVYSYSILFPIMAVVLAASFAVRAKKGSKVINILLAVAYFVVSCIGGFIINEERIAEAEYKKEINFDTVTAEEMQISSSEKQRCREWYYNNVLLKNGTVDLPYSFEVDGVKLNDDIENWDVSVSEESEVGAVYSGGKTSYITLTHKTNSLVVFVEATIYEENATCEWTVYIKNESEENSGVISEFYALNSALDTGKAQLYYSKGSINTSGDFSLMKTELTTAGFSCTEGRSSYEYMPYFNIYRENNGVVLGIGWTGDWAASFDRDGESTAVTVKQEHFKAYLLPGEKVRSPLVSLSFYETKNPLKGFNMFRNWISDCVYPENIPDIMTMMEVAGPESTNTTDQIFETLDTFSDEIYANIDYFWMDAGWYENIDGWYDSLGNWIPDASRYDNGIIEISDYARTKGCELVLWYEPERVYANTVMGNAGSENENWLVFKDDNEFAMWNLAETEAFEYLSEYIAASLNENGVTVYRQDFNYDISGMWKYADKEFYDGRTGICENHYVTNLYRYLDYLCENVDGLIIDNCASGGRRLDLEMTRRSIPLWRSDYNCSTVEDTLEATQSQTYGISFWLPVSGTLSYNSDSEYASRTSIMPCRIETFGTVHSEYFGEYTLQREMMTENYYPLSNGSYFSNKILAMQYSAEDGSYGEALIYKRTNVNQSEYTLKLNGLSSDKSYEVYDVDSPENVYSLTGEELMNEGIVLSLPEGEKAIIVMFEIK